MEFYKPLIQEIASLTAELEKRSFSFDLDLAWEDAGYNQVIMKRDTAFELNGSGFNLVTDENVKDEILVVGDDLGEIKENRSFVRISILQLADEKDEQKAYNLIRKTEYVKYHLFPSGYMMRTSSRFHKEAVRVSKSAIKQGISFQKVGSLMINKYKENPAVKGVKLIFITHTKAPFASFEKIAIKGHDITETLNHVMNSVNFDCSTCNLKPICDEVQGMKELHFKNAGMS